MTLNAFWISMVTKGVIFSPFILAGTEEPDTTHQPFISSLFCSRFCFLTFRLCDSRSREILLVLTFTSFTSCWTARSLSGLTDLLDMSEGVVVLSGGCVIQKSEVWNVPEYKCLLYLQTLENKRYWL